MPIHYLLLSTGYCALADFPLKVFPSMRKLDLKFEISSKFHHLHVVHLLSFFTNLQSLTLSLTDGVYGPLRADQLYSIQEIVSLVSKLGNSKLYVYFRNRSFQLSMLPYLQCALNAIEPGEVATQKVDFHIAFTENCHLRNYIEYSVSEKSVSKFTPVRHINLPSRMGIELIRNLTQQSSLRCTTGEFICRDTSNIFENDSAQLLEAVLKQCSQMKRLILHGSSNFQSENAINSSSILELRLHGLQFHLLLLKDTLFCFPRL
ncbi:hypothetical protein MAM1_0038c02745 [Mucor ambiguus]|uniref:Uncharacterized protein n=1 Tax=Mucor ambiguus TaxID=91626 RepID=A0A0C9MN02_9FUNG|nr:hypothetical protein MAM1_0038c02745 [Mucor ambiguus]